MYFKEFPKFLYDFKYGKETKTSIVTDITNNVRFRKEVLENVTLYDEYDIVDGETPEIIAEKIYGNAQYHWIIMLANQRYHYIDDFPLEEQSLVAQTAVKYNPTLYSSDWYFQGTGSNRKLYFKILNPEDAFDPTKLTAQVAFTVRGATTSGSFNISKVWGTSDSGIDYLTQYFWVKTAEGQTGTKTGNLTITTTGRENNIKQYEITSAGEFDPDNIVHIVNSDFPGAVPVSFAQYEAALNETKRRIKIISPTVISAILKQYKELL